MTDREAIEWLVEYLDDYYDELYTTDELTPDVANVCLSALQEREERSKGCAFCTEDREGYTQKFGAYSIHKNELCTGHCKPRKINFCPMCGRKLKEVEHEAD